MISKFSYNLLVTPELIDEVSKEIRKEVTSEFADYLVTEQTVDAIACFIEQYLQKNKQLGVIPEEYGSYFVSMPYPGYINIDYRPPRFKEDDEMEKRLLEEIRKSAKVECSYCGCTCRYGD